MRPSLYYGFCGTDTAATVRFFKDADIGDLTCDANQIPGRKEKGTLTREELRAFKAPYDEAGVRLSVVTVGWVKRSPEGRAAEDDVLRIRREIAVLGAEGVEVAQIFEMGKVPSEADRGRYFERLCESYREIVRACVDAGVRLAIHAGWVPECALWNTASHLALFEAVPDPHNGVCLCAGSCYQAGDDVVEAVHRLGSRIHCVHFRDADALGGPCVEMLLGKGRVPFAAVAKALRETGYRGPVHCEHFGSFAGERHGEVTAAWAAGFMRALLGASG